MTQEAGNQPKEIKLLPISEMEKMSHVELYKARTNAKTPEEQKHIAPYEHRAFAREYVEENPVTGAIGLAVAIPGYQAVKATGAIGSRTGVDTKQMVEGYRGIGEGLSKGIVEPWKRVWNRLEETFSQPVSKDVPIKPWEKKWNTVEEKPKPSPKVDIKGMNATDKGLVKALEHTPEEEQFNRLIDLTDENVRELERELSRTTSDSSSAILQKEYDRIITERNQLSGQITPGNIDLTNRPIVKNKDGTISTVRSLGVNIDGKEILLPTVINGKIVSDEEAIKEYKRTGKHLGIFTTPEASTRYAEKLHRDQEKLYKGK